MTRHGWVVAQSAAGFPVIMACVVAGISVSWFYEVCQRRRNGGTEPDGTGNSGDGLSTRVDAKGPTNRELVALVRAIHAEFDGTYGVPRMRIELARQGYPVNKKRVVRIMRFCGLVGRHHPRKIRTTIPSEGPGSIPDLIGRRFAPTAPDVGWCGDITYIATKQGTLYLASVLDLGSRRLIGYSMGNNMRTSLVSDALDMAVGLRGALQVQGVTFHSDRGSQYSSNDFQTLCGRYQIRQSMGRVGTCFDNAVAESFWSSLKRECVWGKVYETHAEARAAIFKWILRYNTKRVHTSLGTGMPPIEWEHQYAAQKAA